MRKLEIYFGDRYAGLLSELGKGNYVFSYDDSYLVDKDVPPISVNLPKNKKVFQADHIFPIFTNMLPEGANRRALCRAKKVDEEDFFGMLEMICGMDNIGKVILKQTTK